MAKYKFGICINNPPYNASNNSMKSYRSSSSLLDFASYSKSKSQLQFFNRRHASHASSTMKGSPFQKARAKSRLPPRSLKRYPRNTNNGPLDNNESPHKQHDNGFQAACPEHNSTGLRLPRWIKFDSSRPDKIPVIILRRWRILGPFSPKMEIAGFPIDDKAKAIVAGDFSGISEDGTSMAQFGFNFPNVSWPNRHPVLFWLIVASLGYAAYGKYNEGQGDNSGSDNTVFDTPRFTQFTITKRDEVSPTNPYKKCWDKGVWSVEIKQPELQIARSYTPLPPTSERNASGELRFLIRREVQGEMSGYIFNLREGQDIQLRGPHSEFDLPPELREVVFLAGGTGIAPALQVAHTLLKRGGYVRRIHILWADRRREDCVGGNSTSLFTAEEKESPIIRDLKYLQKQYPGKLSVEYLVNDEGHTIDRLKISQLTKTDRERTSDNERFMFVSGPEGFVNFLAGPKVCEGGNQPGQGILGGLLSQVGLEGWKVWKL